MADPLWDDLSMASIEEALATRYMGQSFLYLDSVTSTQDRAQEEARTGAPEGTMVIAEEQTKGRGRFQRSWVSPRGTDIYLSLVLRPKVEHLLQLGMVASLAVVRAVRTAAGLEARIKWPNDVQIGGRKVAGILIDTELKEGGAACAVVGIGVNVGLDPAAHPEIAAIATSLSREKGGPVRRLPVLTALLQELEGLYEAVKRGEPLLAEYKGALATLGQRVRVTWPGEAPKGKAKRARPAAPQQVEEGVAEDVDAEGALLLRRADGSRARIVAGEVSLRA